MNNSISYPLYLTIEASHAREGSSEIAGLVPSLSDATIANRIKVHQRIEDSKTANQITLYRLSNQRTARHV